MGCCHSSDSVHIESKGKSRKKPVEIHKEHVENLPPIQKDWETHLNEEPTQRKTSDFGSTANIRASVLLRSASYTSARKLNPTEVIERLNASINQKAAQNAKKSTTSSGIEVDVRTLATLNVFNAISTPGVHLASRYNKSPPQSVLTVSDMIAEADPIALTEPTDYTPMADDNNTNTNNNNTNTTSHHDDTVAVVQQQDDDAGVKHQDKNKNDEDDTDEKKQLPLESDADYLLVSTVGVDVDINTEPTSDISRISSEKQNLSKPQTEETTKLKQKKSSVASESQLAPSSKTEEPQRVSPFDVFRDLEKDAVKKQQQLPTPKRKIAPTADNNGRAIPKWKQSVTQEMLDKKWELKKEDVKLKNQISTIPLWKRDYQKRQGTLPKSQRARQLEAIAKISKKDSDDSAKISRKKVNPRLSSNRRVSVSLV